MIAPDNAQAGEYSIPLSMDAETVGSKLTSNCWLTLNVQAQKPKRFVGGIPDYMTYLFAALLFIIVVFAYLKKK